MSWRSNTNRGQRKLESLVLLAFGLVTFPSCTMSTCSDCDGFYGPHLPGVRRVYDSRKGGVQITWINFDEIESDTSAYRIADEWVDLESLPPQPIKGWHLRSHLTQVSYPLPDSAGARIYSHAPPSGHNGFSLNLPDSSWAWSNDTPDYIELLNETGTVVDTMRYGPRK